MPIASTLAGLAMNPLLDSACTAVGGIDASNLFDSTMEHLTRQFAEVEAPLVNALKNAVQFTWQTVEVIYAQDTFWERCVPLVEADDQKKFRTAVKMLAEFTGILRKQDFDPKTCIREIGSARSAGLLAWKDVAVEELARRTVETGQFGQIVPTEQMRWVNIVPLAKQFEQAGYREMSYALQNHPREVESPLVSLIAEYLFRQAVAKEPDLGRIFAPADLGQKTSPLDKHLAVVDRFLRKESDRVEGMLVSLQQGIVGSAVPALDLRIEQHRIGKPYAELYDEVADLVEKLKLSTGAIRRRDSKSLKHDADKRTIAQVIGRYQALPDDERNHRVALRNVIGRLRYLTGDYTAARADFSANVEPLSEPTAKGETLFNAYQCALMLKDWPGALNHLQGAIQCAPRLFIPFPLGKYQLNQILGVSSVGVVFACEARAPKAKVTIKTLDDADEPERIIEEVKSLAGKNLPGIVKVVDCSYVDAARRSGPYVVVQEIESQPMDAYLREHGPVGVRDAVMIGHELSQTLHALHRQNLIHRNLSPETIYLRKVQDEKSGATHWDVRLGDVAFAPKKWPKPAAGTKPRPTDPIEFAPPEQRGEAKTNELSPASDIHAMGRVCCYVLFQNADPSDEELDGLPRGLRELLLDCLEEEPHRRPPDCLSLFRRWEKLKSDEEAVPVESAKARLEEDVLPAAKPVADDLEEDDAPRPAKNANASRPSHRAEKDEDEDDLPRPRRAAKTPVQSRFNRDEDEDDEDDTPAASSKTGLIIGGALALLIAVAGGLYFFVFKKSDTKKSKDSVDVVQNDTSKSANTASRPTNEKPPIQEIEKRDIPKTNPKESVDPQPAVDEPKKVALGPPPQGGDLSKIAWSKVYLSDLTESALHSGPWPVTKNGRLGNDPFPRGPDPANLIFKVQGKPFPKGISMHPPDNFGSTIKEYAFVQYRLMKVGQRLKAQVAIADTGHPLSDVFFEVRGNDKRLWAQGVKAIRQVLDVDVDVAGVDLLELRTYVRGSHMGAHAVWLDPYVTKPGIAPPEDPKLEIPPKSLDKPTAVVAEKGTSYLSDRQEFDVQNGSWPFTKDGRLGNPIDPVGGFKDADEPIAVNETAVPKGLSMVPPVFGAASAKYRLDKQAVRFFTEVALNDKAKKEIRGTTTFEVLGDGKSLWKSEELRETGKILKCDVNVGDVEILELRTSATGSAHGAQAVWINPKVTLKTETMPKKEDSTIVKDDPETAKGKKIYLTVLKPLETEDGAWPITRHGRIGIGEGQKAMAPIKVGGKPIPDGISMHPGKTGPAKMSFEVKKSAKSFIAELGIDDSAFFTRPANFEVYGDGKLIFLSDDVNKNAKLQKVALDVSKYDVVELRTKMADNGGLDECRAIWIDPYFIWDDAKPLPQRQVFLGDLTSFDFRSGPLAIAVGKFPDPKAVGDLSVDDKPAKKGICMVPAVRTGAMIKYPLNRKYSRLIGKVGLNDTAELTPPKGSVTFEILLDEKVVWTSKPVNKSRTLEEFDLDLKGAGVIQLRTRATGSTVGLHAVWIDPVLILKDD